MALTKINRPDSEKLLLGTGEDLQLYHNGTNSIIKDNGTGDFYLMNGSKNSIVAKTDSTVELYHNNVKKLETTSAGVKISGSGTDAIELEGDVWFNNNEHAGADIYFNSGDKHLLFEDSVIAKFGGGADLQIYHDGTDSVIHNTTNKLRLRGNDIWFRNAADNEQLAKFTNGAGVELYFNDSKKFETSANGVILGEDLYIADNNALMIGTGNDLELKHDGTNSIIKNYTGYLNLNTNNFFVGNQANNETFILANANDGVDLYFDNSKKAFTGSTGFNVDGNCDLVSDGNKLQCGNDADLQIYHDGTHSRIVDTRDAGTMRLQADGFKLIDKDAGETMISAAVDGAVELYHNNVKTFSTIATGFEVVKSGHATIQLGSTDAGGATIYFDGDSDGDFGGGDYSYIKHDTDGHMYYIADAPSTHRHHIFKNQGGGSIEEIARFTNYGLAFKGDTAEDNSLNDYEEGTFTPLLGGSNYGTYSITGTGKYTKIGRTVHVEFKFTNQNLDDSASGQMRVRGWPFSINYGSSRPHCGSLMMHNVGLPTNGDNNTYILYGEDSASMYGIYSRDEISWQGWDISNFISAALYFEGTFTYMTD